MTTSHHRRRVRRLHHAGPEERIAAVHSALTREFSDVASPDTVSDVVLAARRDLDSEVPLEAMDEFLHRLAHQRLLDVCTGHRPSIRTRAHR